MSEHFIMICIQKNKSKLPSIATNLPILYCSYSYCYCPHRMRLSLLCIGIAAVSAFRSDIPPLWAVVLPLVLQ